MKNAFRASLEVEGKQVGNVYWDAFTGGKYSQSEVKYTPFDGIQRVFVGLKVTENITLEANYEPTVHGVLLGGPNDEHDMRGREATVTVQDLIPNTNPQQYAQNRAPYKGLVLDIVPPDGDSNDASTLVKIQVVIAIGALTVG